MLPTAEPSLFEDEADRDDTPRVVLSSSSANGGMVVKAATAPAAAPTAAPETEGATSSVRHDAEEEDAEWGDAMPVGANAASVTVDRAVVQRLVEGRRPAGAGAWVGSRPPVVSIGAPARAAVDPASVSPAVIPAEDEAAAPEIGSALAPAPARAPKAAPMFSLDGGWLYLFAGLALLAAAVVIPPHDALTVERARRDAYRIHEAAMSYRLEAYSDFLMALDTEDPDLVRRIALTNFRRLPASATPVAMFPDGLNPSVDRWIDATLPPAPPPAPPALRDSWLRRMATGPNRLWFIAGAFLLMATGLILTPGVGEVDEEGDEADPIDPRDPHDDIEDAIDLIDEDVVLDDPEALDELVTGDEADVPPGPSSEATLDRRETARRRG